MNQHSPTDLPTHLPLTSQQNSADSLTSLLPLLVATAQAIQSQDGTQKVLSCVIIGDRLIDNKALAKTIPETVFAPCDYYNVASFREKGFACRYDLAMILLEPNAVLSQFSDIVVNCRDLSARHVLVVLPSLQNLTAFGFAKVNYLDENGQTLRLDNTDYAAWQFNLFDYKQLPDWFNSRFWANPENWNKFRW